MLLAAQRVRSSHGLAGINCYVYRHAPGPLALTDFAVIEEGAELASQILEIPPGGNTVLSYLDVAAPEGTPTSEMVQATVAILSGPAPSSFPVVQVVGRVGLRLGITFALIPGWRNELRDLAARLLLADERP